MSISNLDDLIDSRDVIERIEELESEIEALTDTLNDMQDDTAAFSRAEIEEAQRAINEWREENGEELAALKTLREEAEGYSSDWQYGATLIRRSYFVEYCQELLSDIGDLPRDIPHYIAIDWDKTADNIEEDYTSVDFDGTEYLIR